MMDLINKDQQCTCTDRNFHSIDSYSHTSCSVINLIHSVFTPEIQANGMLIPGILDCEQPLNKIYFLESCSFSHKMFPLSNIK